MNKANKAMVWIGVAAALIAGTLAATRQEWAVAAFAWAAAVFVVAGMDWKRHRHD